MSRSNAIGEVSKQYNVLVMSILTPADVIDFLKSTASESRKIGGIQERVWSHTLIRYSIRLASLLSL
jgi:hypothetical protein